MGISAKEVFATFSPERQKRIKKMADKLRYEWDELTATKEKMGFTEDEWNAFTEGHECVEALNEALKKKIENLRVEIAKGWDGQASNQTASKITLDKRQGLKQ